MDWIWTSILLLTLPFLVKLLTSKSKNFPPGPRGFPILGSLNLLGEFPHRDLEKLAKIHGSIMFMKLGLIPTIVVSSPQSAELFLKTHDLDFASRPPLQAAKHISYERRNLSFAAYGSYWRNIRKMCTLELLSSVKINAYKSMRKRELGLLVESIRETTRLHDRVVVDVSAKVSSLSADMSCLMVFGKKYLDKDLDERGFKAVIQEAMHLAAVPNLGDYIPFIAPFDFQGLTKRMKGVSKVFDAFFEKIIDEHIHNSDEGRTKDFVDVMLSLMESQDNEYKVERSNIKAIILDMLAASMDTSATAVEWGLSELIRHPAAMKRLQKELEEIVGMNKMVEESHLEKLEYLNMIVKETLRLHPVAPLLIPHAAMKDTKVKGYDIPKNSRVLINVWAIGRDPKVWNEAEKFMPERFEGKSIDLRGHDFELLPFGSGRRGCPGLQLGLTMVKLILGQMVHCFDWELPNGMGIDDLDMTEEFGLTIPRAKHLLAVPTYRLST